LNLKKSFLDTSSKNIDTLDPSLYQCVETRSAKAFDCRLRRFNLFVISETFATQL
jgi:hypothetical protein